MMPTASARRCWTGRVSPKVFKRLGDRVEGRLVADDCTGGGFDVHGLGAVLVAAADEHTPFAGLLGGLGPRQVRVGVHLRGLDDLVQPVRGDGVDESRDPLVDVGGGVLGQFRAVGDDPAGLPRGRVTGLDSGPGEGEPVPQRQGLAEVVGGDPGGDARASRRTRRSRTPGSPDSRRHPAPPRVRRPSQVRRPGPETGPGSRVEAIGVDQGVLEEPRTSARSASARCSAADSSRSAVGSVARSPSNMCVDSTHRHRAAANRSRPRKPLSTRGNITRLWREEPDNQRRLIDPDCSPPISLSMTRQSSSSAALGDEHPQPCRRPRPDRADRRPGADPRVLVGCRSRADIRR